MAQIKEMYSGVSGTYLSKLTNDSVTVGSKWGVGVSKGVVNRENCHDALNAMKELTGVAHKECDVTLMELNLVKN